VLTRNETHTHPGLGRLFPW